MMSTKTFRRDRETIWRAFRAKADRRHPDESETAVLMALTMWAVFIQGQGQEHWRCPCAATDPVEEA